MTHPGDRTIHLQVLQAGRNCWRIARARRAAVLIDAAAYFAALRRVAARARRAIFIIGWDVDSRTPLASREEDGLPLALGDFLYALVNARRDLDIYVLDWDFAMLYALEREILPIYSLGWRRHRRLRFHLDDRHPVGASHHQKMVVVDDAVAFVGGIDLTSRRWDTTAHEPDDPRRSDPEGAPYPPFHDVQMMVDGEAARAIGRLARERWRRATGHDPAGPDHAAGRDLWPQTVQPQFTDVGVGIARTEAAHAGGPEVCEVKQLYVDAIAAARRSLYIENQYFTAPAVAEALARRLRERGGPEIVVVSRHSGRSWLERTTMYVLRARLMRRLSALDRYGRLRFYYPHQPGLGDACIGLHSKVMVVDDRLLRVGSSNLNNRSLGLDTECDLAIEASGVGDRDGIAAVRDRLLAEHLGVGPGAVAAAIDREGSLIRGIEMLRGEGRTLVPLAPELAPELDALVPDAETVDPERPVDPERFVDEIVPREQRPRAVRRIVGISMLLLAVAALAAAWRWGPLAEWLAPETLQAIGLAMRDAPAAPLWIVGGYVLASVVAMPITVLIVATAFVFGPTAGFFYALAGAVTSAAVTFALGRMLGRRPVRRLAGSRVNALSRRLGRGGVLAVLLLRLLPVAPFTLVNLVAGASHLGTREFVVGTVLGMAPGILAVTIFADRLVAALSNPAPIQMAVLVAVVLVIASGSIAIHRWVGRDRGGRGARTR